MIKVIPENITTKYIDYAKYCFKSIISAVCFAVAIFFLLQLKGGTYFYTYLSACFPTGEVVSSIVLLFILTVLGVFVSLPFDFGGFKDYMYIADAVLNLFASIYFATFLVGIPYVKLSIVFTAVYLALTVVSAISIKGAQGQETAQPEDADELEVLHETVEELQETKEEIEYFYNDETEGV